MTTPAGGPFPTAGTVTVDRAAIVNILLTILSSILGRDLIKTAASSRKAPPKANGTMTNHPDNSAQKAARAYILPAVDDEFLLSDSMRGVRFLLEYSKAEMTLKSWGIRSTIVVFGSARVHENGDPVHNRWYNTAREFGRIASEEGGALTRRDGVLDNVIATGGGPGIMEAANRGAHDAGAPNIGYNITLPHEQEPNAYSTPQLTFRFHYFAMRKMHFAMRANALVVFPGGFGTFDELFELLTLSQTHKSSRIPVCLVDRAYWTTIINFDKLAEYGMIHRDDIGLVHFAETAEEIWTYLEGEGVGTHRGRGRTRYGAGELTRPSPTIEPTP